MILEDRRQEKEKKKKTNSPSWIGTSTRVTAQPILTGRLDWGINTAGHYTPTMIEKTRAEPRLHLQTALMRASNQWSEAYRRDEELGGRHHRPEGPPPCGTQRRSDAAPPPTARQREEYRVRSNTRVHRDRQPATKHASLSCAGPPTRRMAPRLGVVSMIAVEVARRSAPPP
jgi:hypothetical protein